MAKMLEVIGALGARKEYIENPIGAERSLNPQSSKKKRMEAPASHSIICLIAYGFCPRRVRIPCAFSADTTSTEATLSI